MNEKYTTEVYRGIVIDVFMNPSGHFFTQLSGKSCFNFESDARNAAKGKIDEILKWHYAGKDHTWIMNKYNVSKAQIMDMVEKAGKGL